MGLAVKPVCPYFLVEHVDCDEIDCYQGAYAVRILQEPTDYSTRGRWHGKTVFIRGTLLRAHTDRWHHLIEESQIIAEVVSEPQ